MQQVMVQWGDVEAFLRNNPEVAPKSHEEIQSVLVTQSEIELAVNIDAGELFVKATYSLEGDGPLTLRYYEIPDGVRTAIQVCHLPNRAAIVKKIVTPYRIRWIMPLLLCS